MSQEFVGPLTVTSPQGVQGGSLELGATLGPTPEMPYVDFHFGLGAAQDFNVRLMNTADNRLDVITALGGTVVSLQGDKMGLGTTTPGAKLVVNELAGGAEVRVDGLNGTVGLSLGADMTQPWVGTRTNHALRLLTNNTEQVRVQANGHVGIGTLAPTQKLDVVGTVKATAFQGSGAELTGVRGTDATKVAKTGDTMTGLLRITTAGTGLRVTNNAAVEGTLTVRNKVGIGTTTPNAMLHIDGTGSDNTGVTAVVRIISGNGAQNLLLDGNEIDATADGLFLNNNTNQDIILANGGGKVGIGTRTPAERLHVVGDVHANNMRGTSDMRVKTDIHVLTHVLEKLEKIRGVSFAWHELSASLGCTPGHRGIGVIAQEVEAVFPELVTRGGEEEYRAIDYGRLTAVLVEAVKELKAEHGVLKQRIEGVEGRSR
jgi:hypothetical protein